MHLSAAAEGSVPDMLFHVAGADPYFDDELGGLAMMIEGLRRRRIPVGVTLV